MKIVSGRIRFKGLLTKVQAIKYNAKHVSRGAFATAEELALQTNVNESMKRIDELQRKLLNWSEAQNYMQMGKHYVRKEAGGDELSELADIATKRMDTVAGELKKEANKLSQLIIDHLSKKEAWGCVDAVRRSLGMKPRGGHAWCFLRLGRNVCWTNTRNIQWVKIMLVSRCDC